MGKVILIINLLFNISISCQEIIVEMKDNDSIKITKINKNEYGIYIYIYIKENIEYNKTQKKVVFPDGIVCETCKLEVIFVFTNRPTKRITRKNKRVVSSDEWKFGYLPYVNYIKIGDYYYKYTGTVIQ